MIKACPLKRQNPVAVYNPRAVEDLYATLLNDNPHLVAARKCTFDGQLCRLPNLSWLRCFESAVGEILRAVPKIAARGEDNQSAHRPGLD
jgi:hypothetical protein